MENIKNVIDLDKFKASIGNDADRKSIDDATIRTVNSLFRELQDIFPAFRQAWPEPLDFDRAKKSWVKGFLVGGIYKISQLKHGIIKCRLSKNPFAPSCGQFMEWCKPSLEDLGLITKEQAYHLAIEMSSPYTRDGLKLSDEQLLIMQHAIQQTSSYDLSTQPKAKTQPIFERNYEIAVRDFIEDKLKPIAKALSDQSLGSDEVLKQNAVAEGFEAFKGYEKAMAKLKDCLKTKKAV